MNETLLLTAAETQFLATRLAADALWPGSEGLTALLAQVPGGDVAGGPHLRALILAMALREDASEQALTLSPSELWLLDSLLIQHDLRREKLADGRPLLELAEKVWRLLVELYGEELPPHLHKEAQDADPSTGTDTGTDQDAGAAVASAGGHTSIRTPSANRRRSAPSNDVKRDGRRYRCV